MLSFGLEEDLNFSYHRGREGLHRGLEGWRIYCIIIKEDGRDFTED